ncbi:ankyrin repeat and LEM domain-containing protein 2 [Carcharodon carcharias]|uniref:ankyrin repeat and LEM domain-containing protein 2 n=1 Tax=Carcharodon carcharias TaxID=13397 RepID=UPI001B7EA0CF|nr:ankyrin repeat and LEM domain-containing protein 2 [Carcharodon carcharias]
MEAILMRLKQLTPTELRQEILNAGLNYGPITSTTRFIFEKKLAQALLQHQGGGEADKLPELTDDSAKPQGNSALCSRFLDVSDCSSAACFGRSHLSSDASANRDAHFGYDVGLNPPDETTLSKDVDVSDLQYSTEQMTGGSTTTSSLYYGVCPVWDDILSRNDTVHVYLDKKEALQAVKLMKGSRFKAFTNREDAEKFARGICDYYPSPSKSSACISPLKASVMCNRDGASSLEVESTNRERANSFKSPRSQDLTSKLRKAIEKGDKTSFLELVWSNPRYLIGSGDNPTVLQEGCRYNAMHVAAKENQPQICQLLLDTLENPDFMLLMYPDDNEIMLQKRIKYIVDLYLNTPDKMGFDTPLHFACKFGHAEVVNVLCSHPDTSKVSKNKYDLTPMEVICERSKTKSDELKEKIREYLQDRYYVPLLRDTDNSCPAVIGSPWSPDQSAKLHCTSLSRHTGNPTDPIMEVRAFAGPMSPSKAEEFRRVWKTPSRDRASEFKKADAERGYERVGRDLAHEMGHPWAEYWEFLGCFVDLVAPEGIRKVEEYLSKRAEQEGGDIHICNRFKSPPPSGKTSKYCNSISVGAFLDDDDISLEELKNRQNAALKVSRSMIIPGKSPRAIEENGCHILPVQRTADIIDSTDNLSKPDIEISPNLNGVCSPVGNEKPGGRCSRSFTRSGSKDILSPVSNLMAEFEKLSLHDNKERNLFSETSEVTAELMGSNVSGLVPHEKSSVYDQDIHYHKADLIETDVLTEMKTRKENPLLTPSQQQPVVEGSDEISDLLSLCTSKVATLQLENQRNYAHSSTLACRTESSPALEREASVHFSIQESNASQNKLNPRSNMQLESITCRSPEDGQQLLPKHTQGHLRRGSTKGIFLVGDEPTKLDSDVLAALSGVDIDPQMFPCLSQWKSRMQSYSVSEMQSWPSPAILKGRPKMQSVTPSSPCSSGLSTHGRSSPLCHSPGKFGSSPYSEFGSPGRYSPAYASHIQVLRLLHFSEPSEL